jgi:hypothetical protein
MACRSSQFPTNHEKWIFLSKFALSYPFFDEDIGDNCANPIQISGRYVRILSHSQSPSRMQRNGFAFRFRRIPWQTSRRAFVASPSMDARRCGKLSAEGAQFFCLAPLFCPGAHGQSVIGGVRICEPEAARRWAQESIIGPIAASRWASEHRVGLSSPLNRRPSPQLPAVAVSLSEPSSSSPHRHRHRHGHRVLKSPMIDEVTDR